MSRKTVWIAAGLILAIGVLAYLSYHQAPAVRVGGRPAGAGEIARQIFHTLRIFDTALTCGLFSAAAGPAVCRRRWSAVPDCRRLSSLLA